MGPVNAATLAATAPAGECQTLGQVLSSIPDVSQWLALLKNAGIENVPLSDPTVQTTLLVPVNSAFTAAIDAAPQRPEKTIGELIGNAPDIVAPLAGYSGKMFQKGSSLSEEERGHIPYYCMYMF